MWYNNGRWVEERGTRGSWEPKAKRNLLILGSVRACVRENGRARLPLDSAVTERNGYDQIIHSPFWLNEFGETDTIVNY